MDRMADACEKILPCPKLRLRAVINMCNRMAKLGVCVCVCVCVCGSVDRMKFSTAAKNKLDGILGGYSD